MIMGLGDFLTSFLIVVGAGILVVFKIVQLITFCRLDFPFFFRQLM
jgi:hypothetical protein